MGDLLKCHLKGKTCKKLANGQDIDYSEEKKWPQCFICPYTGAIFHWSSGHCMTICISLLSDSGTLHQVIVYMFCFAQACVDFNDGCKSGRPREETVMV